jgi:hypothetical protein
MGLEKERPEGGRRRSEMGLENEPLRRYRKRLENSIKTKNIAITEMYDRKMSGGSEPMEKIEETPGKRSEKGAAKMCFENSLNIKWA